MTDKEIQQIIETIAKSLFNVVLRKHPDLPKWEDTTNIPLRAAYLKAATAAVTVLREELNKTSKMQRAPMM